MTKTKPTSVPLDPAIKKDIVLVQKDTASLPARITSDAEYSALEALQAAVHARIKSISAWYDRHMDPISAALKALRAEKKKLLDGPEAWESRVRPLLGAWYERKEREAEKERAAHQRELDREAAAARKLEIKALAKTDREAASALADSPVLAAQAEAVNGARLDGRTFRDDLAVTLVDIDLVPVEYLRRELNVAAVKAAWKSGVRDIPGVSVAAVKSLVNLA